MQQPDQNNGNGQHDSLKAAVEKLIASYDAGGTLLICGNGGSAADCEHIVGELMKGFCRRRPLTADDRTNWPSSAVMMPPSLRTSCNMDCPHCPWSATAR